MFDWPVLRKYDSDHVDRIAMPIGGLGTGTVSLGGRGDLRDWEIVNRPAKGYAPANTFLAVHAGPDFTRLLEGPIPFSEFEGSSGSRTRNHGLPRFHSSTFEAAYPLGQVVLSDDSSPVDARVRAFNPFIPTDVAGSSIPTAILRVVLTNKTNQPLEASVCATLQNFIGFDGTRGKAVENINTIRNDDGLSGVFLSSNGVDPDSEQWGTMALVTNAGPGVTQRAGMANLKWRNGLLDLWEDFAADGRFDSPETYLKSDTPVAAVASAITLAPGATEAVTFLITWHFPNRRSWSPEDGHARWVGGEGANDSGDPIVGNYYTTQYADAWEAAAKTWPELETLESQTVSFVDAFIGADLPDIVKEAALFNSSTLRTQTCFRLPDGHFCGWEGSHDNNGSCYGSCTHVWNYEQALAHLYGELARTMRDVEFVHATRADGLMQFRSTLPLNQGSATLEKLHGQNMAAADGQMGCVMKLYRDWQLSGDDAMLEHLWRHARRALEFCWIPGGWDADKDGVMEGCQHNTMDCEYYGPNPEVGVWYLGALRAAAEMSRYLGDTGFADECDKLFANGSRWVDAHLFNGEYYEQEVRPVHKIAEGISSQDDPPVGDVIPELQIGTGCLADQLVGQMMASVCGLGSLLDDDHMRTALLSLMRYNYRESFEDFFNHFRSYALRDDAGMLVASYPHGNRPKSPFPYCSEVWTGLEYTAAVGMVYAGLKEEALKVVSSVRARHDGRRRNPFDEPECGHHYARALASWGLIPAMTGFHYSGVTKRFEIAPGIANAFWSTGNAWGTFHQTPAKDGLNVQLTVYGGALDLRAIVVTGVGEVDYPDDITIGDGTCLWRSIQATSS